MKTCKKCGVEREDSEFWSEKKNADGLNGACRSCLNKKRAPEGFKPCQCCEPNRDAGHHLGPDLGCTVHPNCNASRVVRARLAAAG